MPESLKLSVWSKSEARRYRLSGVRIASLPSP
jgi:hypothetical protein